MLRLEVRDMGPSRGRIVVTMVPIRKNVCILAFEKRFITYPTPYVLRVGENLYQLSDDPDALENFINHSCEPNAFVNFNNLELRALRDIKPGEEIVYDYCTSDWADEDIFDCRCGAAKCRQRVKGFKYLAKHAQELLLPLVSPFIKQKWQNLQRRR